VSARPSCGKLIAKSVFLPSRVGDRDNACRDRPLEEPGLIDVQLRELARQLGDDHLVYAFLNEIERSWVDRFFYASREPIETHSIKLNLLGDMVTLRAEPGDLLLFIDGDAFPVAPVGERQNPTVVRQKQG
jgi:hypothetical protein